MVGRKYIRSLLVLLHIDIPIWVVTVARLLLTSKGDTHDINSILHACPRNVGLNAPRKPNNQITDRSEHCQYFSDPCYHIETWTLALGAFR
jgi:hypothetical protein